MSIFNFLFIVLMAKETNPDVKAFKKSLKKADPKELVTTIDGVCNSIILKGLSGDVKHDAEAILYNKKPQVNSQTRPTYQRFIAIMLACATGNSQLLAAIRQFQTAHAV